MTVYQPTRKGTVVTPGTMRRLTDGRRRFRAFPTMMTLAKRFRHAAYGCWLTSVRASGADADARDIRMLAADASGVVDEVRAVPHRGRGDRRVDLQPSIVDARDRQGGSRRRGR